MQFPLKYNNSFYWPANIYTPKQAAYVEFFELLQVDSIFRLFFFHFFLTVPEVIAQNSSTCNKHKEVTMGWPPSDENLCDGFLTM